jgi:hypothetical protein
MAVLVVAGAALRLWQYAANAALWLDELAVANNLFTRTVGGLLSAPLADGQVAPPGFLIVSRGVVVVFGESEYALRLFPLLCSLAALPLLARLARRVLLPGGAVLATGLFALSAGVAYFAAEAKQYAGDALVTVLLADLALQWLAAPSARRTIILALMGTLVGWFSQPAVFVLAGVALALLASAPQGQRRLLVPVVALWAVVAALAVVYARSRMESGLMAYMRWFWRAGFMPWPVRTADDLLWPWRAFRDLFALLLDYPWPALYVILAACGVVSLLFRHWRQGLILLLPVVATLAAAMVRAYPLQVRLAFFLVPLLLLLVAEGAWRLGELGGNRWLKQGVLIGAALPPAVGLVRNPPVWRLEEPRPVLAELQRQYRPGDVVYAYYPSWQVLRYYGPRYGFPFDRLDIGNCHGTDLHDYLKELDRYRGHPRVWFFTAFDLNNTRNEREAMLGYLDAIGIRRSAIEGPPITRPGSPRPGLRWSARLPVSAYLYDLSDPVRLASTAAADTQLPPAVQFVGAPRCVYGPVIPHVPTVGAPGAR